MSDKPTLGLQGTDFFLAVFNTMFLMIGVVQDATKSPSLGVASFVVTGLGLWLMFRWLKSSRSPGQRLLGATSMVAATVLVRFALGNVFLN